MAPRKKTSPSISTETVISDYRVAVLSRESSLLGRKEVFGGKAKFGIFGDGKEVAQIAMAHAFRPGDFRSGYYRDQTLMLALGMLSVDEFFAQLYAHADVEADPASAGRSMNAHFATRSLDAQGAWRDLTTTYNSSADVSPTGSQMPRLVGLGYASKLYREIDSLKQLRGFSDDGNEVAFGTIGNASCAEGMFWESVNAIGVLGGPHVISIWDDDYGISVHNDFQVTKGDLSTLLSGFQRESGSTRGFDVHRVCGWDYAALSETYIQATQTARRDHVPALIHVVELTQPQGHSTSGSHERYKSAERLAWEQEYDCLTRMRGWLLERKIVRPGELDEMEQEDRRNARAAMGRAWEAYATPIRKERDVLAERIESAGGAGQAGSQLGPIVDGLRKLANPLRRELFRAAHDAIVALRDTPGDSRTSLLTWYEEQSGVNRERYGSHLHSESGRSALDVEVVAPSYADSAKKVRGFELLNACFDAAFSERPELLAFGEDLGQLGDVNQGFAGLQAKHGALRISDTGIRETTIMGQGIGLAMRGLRPIVEIQYLDYLLYCLQIMSDDLATLQYRTRGGQMAPVIIRTRGHRLEGIWHSGSPMAGIINLVRGIHVCVPRDMTRAAGFYNTILRSDDPALIIEVLNGYRIREKLPTNIGQFTIPLGVPETIRPGSDCTVVTYGACCRIVLDAAQQLAELGIEIEVIDVQTLLPFDRNGAIVESLKRTNRVIFVDEDVPGGTTAYMMQQVLDTHGGYHWLDSLPRAVSARAHRPAYGSDGDYFSKPNREEIFRAVYDLMHEAEPARFPRFF